MVVIFEPEGLLTDTEACRFGAWQIMAREQGIQYDETMDTQLQGMDAEQRLNAILQKGHRDYSPAERFALLARHDDLYDELMDHLGEGAVRTGSVQLLRALRGMSLRLGAVMNGDLPGHILNRLALRSLFDVLSRKEKLGNQLEDVRMRLHAAGYECLLVTAHAESAKLARAQGMQSLLCGYDEEPENILQQILAMLPEKAVQ